MYLIILNIYEQESAFGTDIEINVDWCSYDKRVSKF